MIGFHDVVLVVFPIVPVAFVEIGLKIGVVGYHAHYYPILRVIGINKSAIVE